MYVNNFIRGFRRRVSAAAQIRGSSQYADIRGQARFYQTDKGVLVTVEAINLPKGEGICSSNIFGCHIHEGGSCTGNENDAFFDTGGHYNPKGCLHPYHAGDMPPLFSANGVAVLCFLTDRFTVREIIGKTVVIHAAPDDMRTQPSGASGAKIACGVIISSG